MPVFPSRPPVQDGSYIPEGFGGPAAPRSGPRWGLVFLLMVLCFLSHLNRISMSVAGDARIMKEFDISEVKMGWIYSAFLAVYTIAMLPGGFIIDRFGARTALLIVAFGSALFGALTGATGFLMAGAQLWLTLVIVRGLMGFFSSPLHPGCARAVGDWTPLPQRSLVNGLITGAAIFGVAAAHKLFGTLIERVDWPAAFVVTGVITAAWGSLWWLASRSVEPLPDSGGTVVGGGFAGALGLLTNRSVLLLTVSYGAVGYFQYVFFYWMHYYFETKLLLSPEDSANYAFFPPLAMAVAMPLGGLLSDLLQRRLGLRWGRALVASGSMVLGAVLLFVGIQHKEPLQVVIWFSLALGAVGACEGAFWSTAVELGRRYGGVAAAFVNTGGNAGGLLAPVATPLLAAKYGWPFGIGAGAVICLLGALCWLGIDPARGLGPAPEKPPGPG